MSKRTLEVTAHEAAPKSKRPRNKAALPSNFYKECNKIYAQIEANKYDTKDIISRLVRKSKIGKSKIGKLEFSRPQKQISSPGSRVSKSSIVSSSAPAAAGRQNALVKTDSTEKITTASSSTSAGTKPNGNAQIKTLLSACLSSLTVFADLNKQLLEQHHAASTPQPAALQEQRDLAFLDFDFD